MAESQTDNHQSSAAAAISVGGDGGWERKRGDEPSIDLTVPSSLTNNNQHYRSNGAITSQTSGEKTREDVNIQYSKKPAASMTNTTPTYLRGDAKDDDEQLEKAMRASQQQFRNEQKRMNDEKAQLERVMRESLLAVDTHNSSSRFDRERQQQSVVDDDVIVIDGEGSNDGFNKKTPTDSDKDKKMSANHVAHSKNHNNNNNNDDDDIQKAIRLSLEQQYKPTNNIVASNNNDGDAEFHCRVLSRNEFENVIYPLVSLQGGFHKIEKGKMVQMGNTPGDVKNSKTQSRAQYGRYMIESFWRVLDVLEGKIDTTGDETVSDESDGKIVAKGISLDDGSVDAIKTEDGQQQNKSSSQLGSKITAFVDIGHGIGLQVMQAGWTLDVCSRGIELMEGRHEIAQVIYDGVIDELRDDPPDSTKVDLRLDNLVHCVLPPPGKSERNEELRRFVLFLDKPEAIQKGLVIFANNAEDVFAARSNDSGNGACLDEHLAELFGNMKVGGRIVTLTDIRCHLTSKDDARWYRYESFDSGVGAVSWSPNKSVAVHVLTKISDDWICSNTKNKCPCPPSTVVDENGRLRTKCVYCLEAPLRKLERKRKRRKIYSPEDGD